MDTSRQERTIKSDNSSPSVMQSKNDVAHSKITKENKDLSADIYSQTTILVFEASIIIATMLVFGYLVGKAIDQGAAVNFEFGCAKLCVSSKETMKKV